MGEKIEGQEAIFENSFRMPSSFASVNLSKLILKDLNANQRSLSYTLYNKDQIAGFLKNPQANEKKLRDAAIYIYGASSHFRRVIQYFSSLTDLTYVVSPYKIDTNTAKPDTIRRQYRKTLNTLTSMDIKNQFAKIVTVCLREDVFYGTLWVTNDSITLQQLPSDFCSIAVIEGNVLNVSFNFSYFDQNKDLLELYPQEFQKKYRTYKSKGSKFKWQELDSPTSFAIKCNNDILSYALPPFVGMFREVYDLEDYKGLKMTKTALENYAILAMKLGINSDGEWEMPLETARDFWQNLDSVLPQEVGSILTPMPLEKISFDRSHTGNVDTITDAEQNLFTSAGVSSLLFNNEKASSNALLLSIKVDQAITYGIVKSIEGAINRYIQSLSFGKNFRATFLDCSPFNREDLGTQYLKACQYGLPMVSYYCASQGMTQTEMDSMNFLEDEVLDIKERFIPLRGSSTLSAKDSDGGRPKKGLGEISDNGEISGERGE